MSSNPRLDSQKNKKTVFYIASPGFPHNTIIGREIILKKLIAQGHNSVVIIFDKKTEDIFSNLGADCKVYLFKENRFLMRILRILRFILAGENFPNLPPQMQAGWIDSVSGKNKEKNILKQLIYFFLNCLSVNQIIFLFNKITLLTSTQRLYRSYSPFLSIFYGYVSTIDEAIIVAAAGNTQSKTISMPDRIAAFTDVFYFSKTDLILVWNNLMRKQALEWHGCESNAVKAIGILRVDAYKACDKKLQSRDEFIQTNGLIKNRKIISIIGGNISIFEADRIEKLLSSSGKIRKDIQVLYRPRPGLFSSELQLAQSLKNDNLFLSRSYPQAFAKDQSDDSQLLNTPNFLKNSDVVLARASAMGVEASYFNVPVIFLTYGEREIAYLEQQDHLAMLLKEGGLRVAKNDQELIDALRHYLENPPSDVNAGNDNSARSGDLTDEDSLQRCYREINEFLGETIIESIPPAAK